MEYVIENQPNFIEKFFNFFVSKNSKNKEFSANDAYLQAKYGKVESKEERYENFINELNALITFKCQSNAFHCTIVMPQELVVEYLDEVISKYTEMGFDIINMKDIVHKLNSTILFLSWDNCLNSK